MASRASFEETPRTPSLTSGCCRPRFARRQSRGRWAGGRAWVQNRPAVLSPWSLDTGSGSFVYASTFVRGILVEYTCRKHAEVVLLMSINDCQVCTV